MVALSSRYVQDFDEEKRLGHGNFSDVYQCKHVRDGLQYAVKILRGEASDSSKVLREVWALSALTAHENVIRYYGCWMEDGKLYIQTEFCEEGNLEAKLLAGHSYAEAELVDMLRQVLSGVAHIHKAGLCHLDIKYVSPLTRAFPRSLSFAQARERAHLHGSGRGRGSTCVQVGRLWAGSQHQLMRGFSARR